MSERIEREHARKIVKAIINDLTNRRGLRHEWDQIDDDIRREIVNTWTDIVEETTP